jgi:hypothetical protein
MDWEEGLHRGYYFWVRELANKKWVYSIGKISAGFATPLPGQIVGAEESAKLVTKKVSSCYENCQRIRLSFAQI